MAHVQRHDLGGHHAGVDVPQAGELANQQRRACRQREGECDLGDHEGIAEASLPSAHGAVTARFLQHRLQIGPHGDDGWHEAEHRTGDRTDGKQKQKDAPVEAHFVGSRNLRAGDQHQSIDTPPRQHETGAAAGE